MKRLRHSVVRDVHVHVTGGHVSHDDNSVNSLLYNVCYHSMAKTEKNQESDGTKNALTKAPQINKHCNDSSQTELAGSKRAVLNAYTDHDSAAVNFNRIRKLGGLLSARCLNCKNSLIRCDEEKIENLILCMQCGECCCTDHVLRHYKTARSDPHLVYVDINNWNIRCYDCDCSINADENGLLNQSIKFLKNSRNKKKPTVETPKLEPVFSNTAIQSTAFASRNTDTYSSLNVMIGPRPTSSLQSPRGLCNLGNTCFFNSVLQCLARTPFLVEVLLEMKEPGEKVIMKLEPHPPIDVELRERWGPVTENLVSTLIQITTLPGNAYSPAHLLDALRVKHHQFVGFNQHDAHELLRTLLDCVKNEDLRRYRFELLRCLGLSRKTNPEDVDEKKKILAKEMDKKLTDIVHIRPDPVFRGFTVSANTCTKCNHKSEIPESFLDLSLPVCFFKPQPLSMNRRKNDNAAEKPSKHQLKKERRQAKKNRKSGKTKKRLAATEPQKSRNSEKIKDVNESGYSSSKASSPVLCDSNININNENSNEILAEALHEINAAPLKNSVEEDCEGNIKVELTNKNMVNSLSGVMTNNDVDDIVSCSADVTNNDASAKLYSEDAVASVPSNNSTIIQPVAETSNEQFSSNAVVDVYASPHDPTTVQHLDSVSSSSKEAVKAIVVSPSDSSLDCRLQNSSAYPKQNNNLVGGSSSSAGEDDEDDLDEENEDLDEDVGDSDERDECVDDDETQGLSMTLQPPTSDDEENSIWACLREYTKREVLTGNNKVVCEKCTKEANKSTGEKKQIYRNFTKQLLIKSPPPVLILHLKRFEARGAFSFRKVDTNISFPLTLDVGSFCSTTCEKLLYPGQKKILYSLYGIVEHSGSLNAGHYVAYVKVRNMNKYSYRRHFLRKNAPEQTESQSLSDEELEQRMNDFEHEERQWYYISDSMVRPIDEKDVLRKQAYLLFYERIW